MAQHRPTPKEIQARPGGGVVVDGAWAAHLNMLSPSCIGWQNHSLSLSSMNARCSEVSLLTPSNLTEPTRHPSFL